METVIDYLKRRLREAGPRRWPEIAAAAGVSPRLPAKIVYGERDNPRIQTIQPLLDYFAALDRGEAPVANGHGYLQEQAA
jgi:transcriptional regulator with XRE-family HTH domain